MNFQGGFLKQSPVKNTGSVSWTWYDEQKGIVKWTLKNLTDTPRSFVLFRNGYYFGNAYWPIYVSNPEFNVKFISIKPGEAIPTLPIGIVEQNGAPLAIIDLLKGVKPLTHPDTSPALVDKIVAFVFTLAPYQVYEILEGGFSNSTPPTGAALYEVAVHSTGDYCIGYDPNQVLDWDMQTGTAMSGYLPNPSTFRTVEMIFASSAFSSGSEPPSVALFNDPISAGPCAKPNPSDCEKLVDKAVEDIMKGDVAGFLKSLLEAVGCNADAGPEALERALKEKLEELREERAARAGATAVVAKAMKEADEKLPQPSVPEGKEG